MLTGKEGHQTLRRHVGTLQSSHCPGVPGTSQCLLTWHGVSGAQNMGPSETQWNSSQEGEVVGETAIMGEAPLLPLGVLSPLALLSRPCWPQLVLPQMNFVVQLLKNHH